MTRKQIFLKPPIDFSPKMHVAGCYCEHGNKILFLKRGRTRPEAHTWCLPGGKLEPGEKPRQAAIREVQEEVGLKIDEKDLQDMGALYMRLPHMDYVFYLFRHRFSKRPVVQLAEQEHEEARWVTYEEAIELPLIAGGDEVIDYHKRFVADQI